MLLMSKNLEDRIGSNSGEVFDSKIIFEDGDFPCGLLKTEIDFTENKKIFKIKVPVQVLDHIYNGAIPIGIDYRGGKELRFDPPAVQKVACEKSETIAGSITILTLEIAK